MAPSIVARPSLPLVRFLPARYSRTPRRAVPAWIVLHCTCGAEGYGKAFDGAYAMHQCDSLHRRSAHYFVDSGEVVQGVLDTAEALHAGRTANMHGIGVELCGRADQTREQWLDQKSLPMLCIAARLVAQLCLVHQIPPRLLSRDELRRVTPGITTHAAITDAFHGETTHSDPGTGFPLAEFVLAVKTAPPSSAGV